MKLCRRWPCRVWGWVKEFGPPTVMIATMCVVIWALYWVANKAGYQDGYEAGRLSAGKVCHETYWTPQECPGHAPKHYAQICITCEDSWIGKRICAQGEDLWVGEAITND